MVSDCWSAVLKKVLGSNPGSAKTKSTATARSRCRRLRVDIKPHISHDYITPLSVQSSIRRYKFFSQSLSNTDQMRVEFGGDGLKVGLEKQILAPREQAWGRALCSLRLHEDSEIPKICSEERRRTISFTYVTVLSREPCCLSL